MNFSSNSAPPLLELLCPRGAGAARQAAPAAKRRRPSAACELLITSLGRRDAARLVRARDARARLSTTSRTLRSLASSGSKTKTRRLEQLHEGAVHKTKTRRLEQLHEGACSIPARATKARQILVTTFLSFSAAAAFSWPLSKTPLLPSLQSVRPDVMLAESHFPQHQILITGEVVYAHSLPGRSPRTGRRVALQGKRISSIDNRPASARPRARATSRAWRAPDRRRVRKRMCGLL